MTTNLNNLVPGRRYRITKLGTGRVFTGTFVRINGNEMLKFRNITIGNDGRVKPEYDVQPSTIENVEEVFTAGKMKKRRTRKRKRSHKNLKSRKSRNHK
jgi:hypothetical protein